MLGSAAAASGAPAGPLVWSVASPSTSPPPLRDPAMAYDPDAGGEVVLFGGALQNGSLSDQTWEWNGARWQQAALGGAGANGPAARSGASLAFDPVHHQFLLFGGLASDGTALDDSWAWNGASWARVTPTSPPPPGVYDAAMASNPGAAGGIVLVGGTIPAAQPSPTSTTPSTLPPSTTATTAPAGPTLQPDTYTWDGQGWHDLGGAGMTTARTGAAMALDPLHSQTVLFGGSPAPAGAAPAPAPLADTWAWNGTVWTQLAPAASPPGRGSAQLVSDPQTGGLALTGGSTGSAVATDTWAWDGASWTTVAASGPQPARVAAGAAFDVAHGDAVLYGGVDAAGSILGSTAVLAPAPPPAAPTTSTEPAAKTAPAAGSATTTPPAPAATHPRATSTTTTVGRQPVIGAVPPSHASPAALGPPPTLAAPAPTAGRETVHPGDHVVLLGTGFMPGATVSITFRSTARHLGAVTADPEGRASASVVVPNGVASGHHAFEMSGPGADGTTIAYYTDVVVMPAGASHGFDVQTPVLLAVALVLPLATWLALSVRSRRRTSAVAGP